MTFHAMLHNICHFFSKPLMRDVVPCTVALWTSSSSPPGIFRFYERRKSHVRHALELNFMNEESLGAAQQTRSWYLHMREKYASEVLYYGHVHLRRLQRA